MVSGKDVTTSLAYKDQTNALQKHVRPKHKTTFENLLQKGEADRTPPSQNRPPLANQQPRELYVNEPGMYSLIFRSKLPEDLLQQGRSNQPDCGPNQPPLANQQPHELYVKEPGLYSLIFRSRLPKAEAFMDCVSEEVLLAIRRTGRYAHGDSTKSNDFLEMPT